LPGSSSSDLPAVLILSVTRRTLLAALSRPRPHPRTPRATAPADHRMNPKSTQDLPRLTPYGTSRCLAGSFVGTLRATFQGNYGDFLWAESRHPVSSSRNESDTRTSTYDARPSKPLHLKAQCALETAKQMLYF